jgi:hypothetical protein
MKFIFGIWTVAVALAVSAVAAYYSIIGLTAIFSAAVIPIIIMGVTLEVAKVTSAIWLHSFWDDAPLLTKTYLTSAVVILMFITSMGIFGFLSKAHIEQAANSGGIAAQIERVEQEISREQQTIERATVAIDSFGQRVVSADIDIQARIETQERLIADITLRQASALATQNQLIMQSNTIQGPLQEELDRIRSQRQELSTAQSNNDVERLQAIVGARVDGVLGADTRNRIDIASTRLAARQAEIITSLERLQTIDNPTVIAARAEITRLNNAAHAEIARAQEAINSFRNQLITVTTADNTAEISQQELVIDVANNQISELLTRQFSLQGELRVLEVEVGPVKYIAELIYGQTDTQILEEAVRWVIIIIVLVFDPLAIVLVLAGLSILHRQPIDNYPEIHHNDSIPPISTSDTPDDVVTEPEVQAANAPSIQPRTAPQGGILIDRR